MNGRLRAIAGCARATTYVRSPRRPRRAVGDDHAPISHLTASTRDPDGGGTRSSEEARHKAESAVG